MAEDWNEALKRFDERTVKRREKAKEHDEEAQRVIREAEERHPEERHPSENQPTSEEWPE
jgi:hypothetical protein